MQTKINRPMEDTISLTKYVGGSPANIAIAAARLGLKAGFMGDVSEAYISGAKALLVSGTALSRSPSREAAFKALEHARKHGAVVFFDIDYRPYSWMSKAEVYTYCRLVAMQSDVILGGREELDLIEPSPADKETRDDGETAQR
jgi:5-dehydro-2-deoxygluconokinase